MRILVVGRVVTVIVLSVLAVVPVVAAPFSTLPGRRAAARSAMRRPSKQAGGVTVPGAGGREHKAKRAG